MTSGPRLLVTGANGAIGRRLRERLGSDGADAMFLTGPHASRSWERTTVPVDLTAADEVEDAVARHRPDVIVHLAAVSGPACDADPALAAAINVGGTRSLAAAAARHRVRRFVLASTSAIYGDRHDAPVAETAEPVIGSEYARTKLAAEQALADQARRSSTLTGTALRIFNVYGPGMRQSLPNRLIEATRERPVTLFGLDEFVRDHVHVDDVVDALIAAAAVETVPAIVNIGSGRPTSNRALVDALSPVAVVVGPPRPSYSCADIRVAQAALGFRPRRALSRATVG